MFPKLTEFHQNNSKIKKLISGAIYYRVAPAYKFIFINMQTKQVLKKSHLCKLRILQYKRSLYRIFILNIAIYNFSGVPQLKIAIYNF